MKLIVGVIALSLAHLTNLFSDSGQLTSISESYWSDGWSRSIFVGFLFAIAAFLVAYDGRSTTELVLSKVASIAALGVALFPCQCDVHEEVIQHAHSISAAVMFLILAAFCWIFLKRARDKGHLQAKARSWIYAVCGVSILASIAVLAYDNFTGGSISAHVPRLTFYGERAGLWAFGISWLTASKVVPGISRSDERFVPMFRTPAEPAVADAAAREPRSVRAAA